MSTLIPASEFLALQFSFQAEISSSYQVAVLDILRRFQQNEIMSIMAPDGELFSPIQFDSPEHKKIYMNSIIEHKDFDVSKIVAKHLNDYCREYQHLFTEETKSQALLLVIKLYDWIHPGMKDFYNMFLFSLKKDIFSMHNSLSAKEIEAFVYNFCLQTSLSLKRQFAGIEIDADTRMLLKTKVKINRGDSQCVLIVTDEAGGCHKNIADHIYSALSVQNETVALINESTLHEHDVLSRFFGIPMTRIYTELFQKRKMATLGKAFRKINEYLLLFVHDSRPLLLKQAMHYIEETTETSVNRLYITTHKGHMPRYARTGITLFAQVCDFGEPHTLTSNLLQCASLAPHLSDFKGLLVSPNNFLNWSARASVSSLHTIHYVTYPIRVLTEEEYGELLPIVIEEHKLNKNDNVIRIVLSMGAFGVGGDIRGILHKVISEAETLNGNICYEFILICGHNILLLEALKNEYSQVVYPNNKIEIKVLGFLENKKYIALAKSGILWTKPGGGSVAEALLNNIRCILIFNGYLTWERSNIREMIERGYGIEYNEDASIFNQIEEAMNLKLNKECLPSNQCNYPSVAQVLGSFWQPRVSSNRIMRLSTEEKINTNAML